jgi:hypothetical protein
MKQKLLLAYLIGLMGCVGAVQATPLQYAFYASEISEWDGNGYTVNAADRLFATPVTISGAFSYAADAPPLFVDAPASGDLAGFGSFSYYYGSLSNLSGNVGSYLFSAASGSTLVADSNASNGVNDGVFNLFGTINGIVEGTGFSGFSIGGFNLLSVNVYNIGGVNYLGSQSLPTHLSRGSISAIDLVFEDDNHVQRKVRFWGDFSPVPVPVPAAAWLFGSGLIGLAGVTGRRKAL